MSSSSSTNIAQRSGSEQITRLRQPVYASVWLFDRLAKLRNEAERTQRQVAEHVGVSHYMPERWESSRPDRRRPVPFVHLARIAESLGITVNVLLAGTGVETRYAKWLAGDDTPDTTPVYVSVWPDRWTAGPHLEAEMAEERERLAARRAAEAQVLARESRPVPGRPGSTKRPFLRARVSGSYRFGSLLDESRVESAA